MNRVICVIAYLLLAPLIGGLMDSFDRIVSARMQRRKGPSVWQPFYDLRKLFSKQMLAVNNVQLLLNLSYLVFIVIAGAMLFGGMDILMCLFILSTADMFLVMAASSDSSPFANMGASREMVQMMAYEPLTLLVADRILPCGGHHSGAGQRGGVYAGVFGGLYVYGGVKAEKIPLRPVHEPSCPSGDGKGHYDRDERGDAGGHEYRGIL